MAGLLGPSSTPRCRWPSRQAAWAAPAPLFTVFVQLPAFQLQRQDQAAEWGWRGAQVLPPYNRTNCPLVVSVDDWGEAFSVVAETVAPAVPEQVCALLVTALDGLVTALEQAPATPLYQIAVLEAAERAQVVAGWNDTAAAASAASVPELIAARAARIPDAVAVRVRGCSPELMGSWMRGRGGWRGLLASRGVGPETVVGLCLERGAWNWWPRLWGCGGPGRRTCRWIRRIRGPGRSFCWLMAAQGCWSPARARMTAVAGVTVGLVVAGWAARGCDAASFGRAGAGGGRRRM